MTVDNKPENQDPQPSPSKAWANLRQPMPLGRKWRLFYRNLWIRIQTRQDCCGHPGQPGC
jgi:hypothetical protein